MACGEPTPRPPAAPLPWWPGAVVIVIVVVASATLLLADRPVGEAVALAAATVLLAGELARRLLASGGPWPVVAVTAAVTALATVLLLRGVPLTDVAIAVGLTGLVAGEVAARLTGTPRPRLGV